MARSSARRIEGQLESWNVQRGFGFLTVPHGAKPVFVHVSAFTGMIGRPTVGDRYEFQIEKAERGKVRAVAVVALGHSDVPRERRPPRPPSVVWLAVLAFVLLYIVLNLVWSIPIWFAVAYVAMSAISFGQYAFDKRAAQRGSWRTPESTLQLTAFLCGWPGALAGQQLLRHKTRKLSFLQAFWAAAILNVLSFVLVVTVVYGDLVEVLTR